MFRAYQRGRVYEAGLPGVSAPPGPPLSTLAARAFSQLDPEASPGDLDDEDFPRGTIATISSARDSPQIPGPAGPPSAHASPKGAMPTLLEKVHRYVWPKEREECPQVAFEQKPCREIPITQWILRRVRRLPLFTKKKGKHETGRGGRDGPLASGLREAPSDVFSCLFFKIIGEHLFSL